jgi:2-methylcitrate dehydratase PrpD
MKIQMIDKFVNQLIKKPNKISIKKAKLEIIDWIGYSVAGTFTEQAKPFNNLQKILPNGKSLNLFDKKQLSVFDSAFINASVGNILELDDVHRTSIIHPGDTIIPAAIATASHKKVTTLNFLIAIISGYEAAIRMGNCLGPEHYKTFYSSSTCGVFGAATASSYILNVNNDKKSFTENLKNSLNLATMTSSGIWQCRNGEGEAKQYALANASKCGVTAAYMAQHDSKAPIDMIEGELGFLKGYAEKIEYNELIKEENIHLINEISNKPWPACRHSHPVIGVSLYIKQEAAKKNVTFDEIEKIEIETYSTAIEFCDKKEPKNNIEGKFSLQHCCALSLIYGKIIDEYFNISYLEKIEVKNIINKIKIVENKKMSKNFPRNYSASINVKFKNGLSIKKTNIHAKGDPENPMTEKEICDKSFNLIESKIDAKHDVNLLIEKILNSNEENDISNIKWFDDLQKIINKKEH